MPRDMALSLSLHKHREEAVELQGSRASDRFLFRISAVSLFPVNVLRVLQLCLNEYRHHPRSSFAQPLPRLACLATRDISLVGVFLEPTWHAMDPVSIVGLVSSVLNIVSVIAKNVNALSTLQANYRNADMSVFLLIGQLSTLKAALGQIAEWIKTEGLASKLEHVQLVQDLQVALNGCQILISILDDRVDQLATKEGSESLKVQGKIAFLWEEQELNVYVTHLNNQVNALNLLLSAIQCRSLSKERTLLLSVESRHVFQQLTDDVSSLLLLRDSDSALTRKTVSTFNSELF